MHHLIHPVGKSSNFMSFVVSVIDVSLSNLQYHTSLTQVRMSLKSKDVPNISKSSLPD